VAKARGNPEKLIPTNKRTKKEASDLGRLGGIKSGEVRREKKRMSQIYADFLAAEHEIDIDEVRVKLEGPKLLAHVMKQVLSRGDSSSVSMMKEIREATEGSNLTITSEIPQVILQGPPDEQ
jgi:hypothetical protein